VDFQHGFRNKRSCESQIVITTEDIARNLDNQQVDMLILDFSKAFDTVPHKRLLKKLESYGINRNILSCVLVQLTILSRSCSRLQSSLVDIAKYSRLSSANRRILDVMSLPISLIYKRNIKGVPHKRLLKKLESYGINGNILSWLEAWLTQREQQVTIEGDKSSTAKVTSVQLSELVCPKTWCS
jgi:hypothetical protein